jgi:hypothetical protein
MGVSGATACVLGTSCPQGTDQLCSMTVPCPTGDTCRPLLGGGGGGGGGGGTEVCRPMMTKPDGGGFPPPKDAGAAD